MARESSPLGRLIQLVADLWIGGTEGPRARPMAHPGDSAEAESPAPKKRATSRSRSRKRSSSSRGSRRKTERRPKESRVDKSLRAEVAKWRGVPYRMGGTDRSGIDCSGFVRTAYRDLFDRRLPRTTSQQAKTGSKVAKGDLEPGDLVFFKISSRTRHVGAWVGRGEFVHASSSRGVTVSRLDSSYWRKRYWTARRVLA